MSKLIKTPDSGKAINGPAGEERERRQVLKSLGRFAAVTAPAVVVILAADGKSAHALMQSSIGQTGMTGPTGPSGPPQ